MSLVGAVYRDEDPELYFRWMDDGAVPQALLLLFVSACINKHASHAKGVIGSADALSSCRVVGPNGS
jgi:hypothetical protein